MNEINKVGPTSLGEDQRPELLIKVSPPNQPGGFQGTGPGGYQGSGPQLAHQAASTALPALADAISGVAHDFWQRIAQSNARPKELELEMGVKLEGKFQWLIVAGGEATVTVRLKW